MKKVEYPALVFADLHAQKKIMPELAYFFSVTVPKVYKANKCKSIIIIGDVFHVASQIDTELYVMVFNNLRGLAEQLLGTTIHLVMGNHDIFMKDVTPLLPFSTIAEVYDKHTIIDNTEFIPYNDLPDIEGKGWAMKSGNTFIHYALKEVVDKLSIPYNMGWVNPPFNDRKYFSGHIHIPVFAERSASLGCPIQWMFDGIEENNVYIVDEKGKLSSYNTEITRFNIIEVHSKKDLETNIQYGEVTTYVKLKLFTEEVTNEDINKFKKDKNITTIIQRMIKPTTVKGTLNTDNANNTVGVYKQFLQQANTTLNKRDLYQIVLSKVGTHANTI